jgi:Dimethyladenosine transferase (rRNA methylation)
VIHEAAARGYEASADTYERARPGYSDAAVAQLVDGLRLSPGDTVVDIGAGTGKLTRSLTGGGAHPVAVEPVAAMRRIFAAVLPGVPVLGATGRGAPPPEPERRRRGQSARRSTGSTLPPP